MPILSPDDVQGDEAWTHSGLGDFIYVPLAWRTGHPQTPPGVGPDAEIEAALKELHASYHDLPIPDRLLDLVRRTQG